MKATVNGGERGRVGDSPLDTEKMQSPSWKPEVSIQDTIRKTVGWLLTNPYVYER